MIDVTVNSLGVLWIHRLLQCRYGLLRSVQEAGTLSFFNREVVWSLKLMAAVFCALIYSTRAVKGRPSPVVIGNVSAGRLLNV
jgi:hypothetical protein